MRRYALTLALLTLPLAAPAQWPTTPYDALLVFSAPETYVGMYTKPVTIQNGDKLVTYLVEPMLPASYTNYVQRITIMGEKLWGENGIPICTPADSTQMSARMVSDGEGGALVVWWDARGTFPDYQLYGQHFSSAGEILWEAGGRFLTSPSYYISANYFGICPDGEGGAYAAWQQGEQGGSGFTDIYAQRIDGSGNALWPQNVPVCTVVNESAQAPRAALHEGGGCFVVWHDYRAGLDPIAYGQRLAPDGSRLWQINGINLNIEPSWDSDIMPDTEGGFLFRNVAQVMRVNENGQVLWTQQLSQSPTFQFAHDWALSPSGRLYVPFGDWPHPITDQDAYAQCFDLQGNYLWDPQGVPIAVAPAEQGDPYLALIENGIIACFGDSRNYPTTNVDAYFQIVDSAGNITMGRGGEPFYSTREEEGPAYQMVCEDGLSAAISFCQRYNVWLLASRILPNGELGYFTTPPVEEHPGELIVSVSPEELNFTLPHAGNVEIELFDLLGRRLWQTRQSYASGGSYALQVDNLHLTSGLYILRLSTLDQRATPKLVIWK